MKILDVLCCTVTLMVRCQAVCKADDRYHSLFTTPGMDQRKTGIVTVGHHPLCVSVTRSPRPSPQYFILEVIKYWQWEWPGNEAREGP